ncbi:hypothetical protein NEF87_000706 [Candidatus Lokiarchaeum ossiferum]|uniref:Uncharacterized protein n=1 Tax=Candidatus Lokiarchaeum ossiferum TaxID=2951803 RepID=A0ABY6HLY7_9ARCH|nr:hypothetical protein NEF87_000706 [Candidatus Lokiarchaeum sp. B-35]
MEGAKLDQDLVDSHEEGNTMIPDAALEKKIFLYGFGITILLWGYILIVRGSAMYFILPTIALTLILIFLYSRYVKRKNRMAWLETTFQEFKQNTLHHNDQN